MPDRFGDEQDEPRARHHVNDGPRRVPVTHTEVVRAGTPASVCRGSTCRAEIYWVERAKIVKGRPVPGTKVRVPVDCSPPLGRKPTSIDDGQGVSHYTTCPDAGKFGGKR